MMVESMCVAFFWVRRAKEYTQKIKISNCKCKSVKSFILEDNTIAVNSIEWIIRKLVFIDTMNYRSFNLSNVLVQFSSHSYRNDTASLTLPAHFALSW